MGREVCKSFTVPVELVVKPAAEVPTSQKPFFDPAASTSSLARPASVTGPSLVQATGEAVDEMQTATQPLEAPGAGTATQPVQAPGSVPDVLPSGTGDAELSAEQTLTGRVVQSSSDSDSEDGQQSVTGSLLEGNYRDRTPDRDLTRDDSADQEVSEEANYRETIRGVRSFMGWHKVPEFESVSSFDNNPFAISRVQPTGKVSVKLPEDDWLCKKMDKLNLTITEGYPAKNTDTAGLSKDQFIKPPGHPDGMGCILRRRTVRVTQYTLGHQNQPSSTIPSVELQDKAFLLPHPPGPSAKTCLGVGREQLMNKLSCATRLLDCQDA